MHPAENFVIRVEDSTRDRASIRVVNESAFGGSEEADLVDRLRADGNALISLVGELQMSVVGHVLFSRMSIDTEGGPIDAVAPGACGRVA